MQATVLAACSRSASGSDQAAMCPASTISSVGSWSLCVESYIRMLVCIFCVGKYVLCLGVYLHFAWGGELVGPSCDRVWVLLAAAHWLRFK